MTKFAPSPILLPSKLGAAAHALVSDDHSDDKNKWISEHKAIAPYLAMVARASANAKIDPAFQAAILAQENGGFDRWGNAVSSAGAQGIAQFMPSTWAGSWNPYRNKSPNDIPTAIAAQAVFLRMLLKNHGGNMLQAAGEYYGAMDPAYTGGVQKYYNELTSNHVFSGAGKSILSGIGDAASDIIGAPGKILGAGKDAAEFIGELAEVILNPTKLAELLADVFAWWVKLVWKSIWKWVLAPPFHWCQRATVYYFDNIMGSKDGRNSGYYYDYAAGVTVAFWAVGYSILWRHSDDISLPANSGTDSAVGRAVSTASSLVAKRKVTSPNKVKAATPDKPKPVPSKAPVEKVRTLSATRRRSVTVGTGGTLDHGRNVRGNRDGDGPVRSSDSPATGAAESDVPVTQTESVAA